MEYWQFMCSAPAGNCSANSFLITTGLQLNHFSHHHQNLQHELVLHCQVSLVDGITR